MHLCTHASIARYNKYQRKAGKQAEEEERVQVWLFVDVFQDNDCGKAILSFFILFIILFHTTILYSHCSDTHRKHLFYAWLVSISSSLHDKRQTIQRNLVVALTIEKERKKNIYMCFKSFKEMEWFLITINKTN